MKICLKCGTEKEFSEYHKKRGKPQPQCKACRSEYMRKLYENNKEVEKAKRKAWYEKNKLLVSEKGKKQRQENPDKYNFGRRLKKYGITKEVYFEKMAEQNGSCGICKMPFLESPAIDHCHKTGQFRGLLCDKCNTGLGLLNEDIPTMQRAIEFIKKYKK